MDLPTLLVFAASPDPNNRTVVASTLSHGAALERPKEQA